ncbi:MAG: Lrp/AsnC family transcriptional regulator [Halieaceae bacterium]|nr:Lrp/AsnC family transcriptional regulator [Halieaceae bacterium]
MTTELSSLDIEILDLLQQDASLTSQQIAERINLSQSPCWRRIQRLREEGLIERQVALLNREKLGMEVVVFTTINLANQGRKYLEAFEEQVKNFPEVLECYTMAGSWDYMLKIVARDIRHYERFIREQLTSLELIGEIHSHIAVTEIKNSTQLPLVSQL